MNNEREHNLFRRHDPLARLLAFMLLGFIFYGTTVEAAHTHGALKSSSVAVGSSNFSNPGTEVKTATNLVACGDCLICQLHQQFSASVIAVPPSIVPASLASRHFNLVATTFLSHTAAPRTGRAPPQTIL